MNTNDSYIIQGPVSPELIRSLIEDLSRKPEVGGHSLFIGQVRADQNNSSKVAAIEYSAYDSMVKEEADKIVRETYSLFNDVIQVTLMHSIGLVKAGEISLFILVAAVHRRQAIDACSRIVEMIKERLPVWKKEIYEDNTRVWKSNNVT